MKHRALFITLEGIDGTGKSTQARLLTRYLRRRGLGVCATREPGSTRIGERIRDLLLASRNTRISALTELALMYAARAQHLEEVVRPALERGEVVVSDRFNDASFAYQGYGRRLGTRVVRVLDRVVCGSVQPDLTLLLDMDPAVALRRAAVRETRSRSRHRRFERTGLEFQKRVRKGYLAIARRNPERVKVVSSKGSVQQVQAEIRQLVDKLLHQRGTESQI